MKAVWFIFALLAVFAVACRTDKPPALSLICTLDGFGGGDCTDAAGTNVYKAPSKMKNFWATTQTDEANFTAWCYKTSPAVANAALDRIKARMLTDPSAPGEASTGPEVLWAQRGAHAE